MSPEKTLYEVFTPEARSNVWLEERLMQEEERADRYLALLRDMCSDGCEVSDENPCGECTPCTIMKTIEQ